MGNAPASKPPFSVSVTIPVYGHWEDLSRCLEALEQQTHPRDQFEILIVNNQPGAEAPVTLPLGHRTRLLHESTPGSYAARNAGIRAARGEILAFTDADCIPHADWIEQALEVFRHQPDVSRLAGAIELTYRNPTRKSTVELFEQIFAFQQRTTVEVQGSAITANMFARREIFKKIGGFDENLKSGGDSEWGLRAEAAGYKIVYAPQVRVLHPARHSWAQLYRKTVRLYGGKWQRAHAQRSSKLTLGEKARIFRPGTSTLSRALSTEQLNPFARLKVLAVIFFVGAVQLTEHTRLLLGGRPRRA